MPRWMCWRSAPFCIERPLREDFGSNWPYAPTTYALAAMKYIAPRWLPGGQLQTIWPALYARRVFGPRPEYRRERWRLVAHHASPGVAPDAQVDVLAQRPVLH